MLKRNFREQLVPTPATYKEYAAECLTAMRAAVLPEVRAMLLAMAQRWNEFAERAERKETPGALPGSATPDRAA